MDKETEVWFAMRATYRRELEAMHLLEKANLGCFIPMQYKISIRRGRKVRALVPVIRNLVFVHARPSEVQRFKSQITYLQYITDWRAFPSKMLLWALIGRRSLLIRRFLARKTFFTLALRT